MNKSSIAIALLTLTPALVSTGCAQRSSHPTTTKYPVNLNKYAGRWYEIASFPAFFQRNCTCTQAVYKIKREHVQVINSCYKYSKSGKYSQAVGKAFATPNSGNRKLKVQFFWPFKGDYWILHLSKGYKTVIVGNPEYKYLWILSRTPRISNSRYNKLLSIAKSKGYDIKKLNKTPQNCPWRPIPKIK